jgi:hypothetical protein
MTTEPARSIATANDVGWVPVDAPLLLLQGTADTTVVLPRTRDLFARLCRDGQSTRYLEYAGAGHGDVLLRATADVQVWISDRLAGVPSANSCPAPTPPTVTVGNGSVRERDRGISVLRIPVRLSAPLAHAVGVPWRTFTTANADVPVATPGVDYIARRGIAWIPAGRVTGWINIAIRADRVHEPDESVAVALGPTPGVAAGGYFGLGAGTVFDND